MCATFTDDDVGKPVERADGTVIGTVAAIEEGRARVEPAPDAIDTIKARLGWDEIGDPFVLEADAVDAVSDTRVHLEEGFSEGGAEPSGGTEPSASTDRSEDRRDDPKNRPDQ